MATFSPTRALSRVDFPALGRPRMQTKPERKDIRKLLSCYAVASWYGTIPGNGASLRSRFRIELPSYQLHLLRLRRGYADALNFAVRGFQNFKTQAIVFNYFALARNSPGELADQAGNRGGLLALRLAAEEFVQAIQIHSARDDEGMIALANDFRLIPLIADFADNFFHQVFNRN